MFGQEILLTISNLKIAYYIVKNSDKEKWVYSCNGITFDGEGSWSSDNDFTRNVIIFGADNSSPSYAANHKNNFFMLCEGTFFGVNGSFSSPEKKVSINFSKANTKFAWVYIIILIIVICLSMEKKYLSLKSTIKIKTSTSQPNFVLGAYLVDLVLLSLKSIFK